MAYINRPATQYLSTRTFNDAFFSYDDNQGLQPVLGANGPQCPAGRILKENGRKLFPGINPTVKTIMVGVIDSVTRLSGFIDPNCAIFTLFATKSAPEHEAGLDYNPRGLPQQGVQHKGQSVYTLGDVVAGGQFYPINSIDLGSDPYINADFSQTTYHTIEITQDTLLNASVVPPNKGTVIYLAIKGDGVAKLNFGNNFAQNLPFIVPDSNQKITIEFISDGNRLETLSQTSAGVIISNPIYQVVSF